MYQPCAIHEIFNVWPSYTPCTIHVTRDLPVYLCIVHGCTIHITWPFPSRLSTGSVWRFRTRTARGTCTGSAVYRSTTAVWLGRSWCRMYGMARRDTVRRVSNGVLVWEGVPVHCIRGPVPEMARDEWVVTGYRYLRRSTRFCVPKNCPQVLKGSPLTSSIPVTGRKLLDSGSRPKSERDRSPNWHRSQAMTRLWP